MVAGSSLAVKPPVGPQPAGLHARTLLDDLDDELAAAHDSLQQGPSMTPDPPHRTTSRQLWQADLPTDPAEAPPAGPMERQWDPGEPRLPVKEPAQASRLPPDQDRPHGRASSAAAEYEKLQLQLDIALPAGMSHAEAVDLLTSTAQPANANDNSQPGDASSCCAVAFSMTRPRGLQDLLGCTLTLTLHNGQNDGCVALHQRYPILTCAARAW